MQYIVLFLEGILTFLSPCLLPMLPVYVTYFAAGEADRRRALVNSLGFVAGFTAVFVALGAFAGLAGRLLSQYAAAVNLITGGVVILLGLSVLGVLDLPFLRPAGSGAGRVRSLRFLSSLVLGVVFSVGWTPCVGAFLGSALMLASRQGGAGTGVWMLLVYSLGLGIPFVASALLLDRLKGAFSWIQAHYREINLVSGLLLVAVGLLMAGGLMGRLLALLA